MLLKCCTQFARKLENSPVTTGLEKVNFIPIPRKGNATEYSNYHIIALSSQTWKVMLKILQARLQHYVNCELPDFKLDLEKANVLSYAIVSMDICLL